jgi:hypothetical protein
MKKIKLAALAALSTASASTFAAVPADVTTALTDAKIDVVAIGGAVLIVVVAIAAFRYMKRTF